MQPYYDDGVVTIYLGRWESVGLPVANLVLTDPPYNAINRTTAGLRILDKGEADATPVDIEEVADALVATGAHTLYTWCSQEQLSQWLRAFQERGLTTRTGVWWKTNPSPMNGQHLWLSALEFCAFGRRAKATFTQHCAHPVWRGPVARRNGHPTPKPLWLMKQLIEASSTANQIVLDPFMGSGTSLVAAKTLGRRAVGIDMDERYCELAAKRCSEVEKVAA